jgi:hypothetical protein
MPWRKTRPITPGSRVCWFRGTIPRVAPRRVSFSKTAIHSHSGEFWSGDCENWGETSPSTDLFFLNDWNEWAEGNHLEPDQKFGLGYLEELRRVCNRVAGEFGWPKILDNGH